MQKIYALSNPDDYDFDSNFVEFSGGKAKLKIQDSQGVYSQSFASSTGFTYDSAKAEFTGGLLRQLDQRPSGALLGASYSSSIDASWLSSGSVTATANDSAAVSAGKLNCIGGTKSVDYVGTSFLPTNAGCIRVRWTPNYSGAPTDTQYFFTIQENDSSTNSLIQLMHHSNGSLFLLVNDADGVNVYSNSLLVFNANAGTESVIELGWDLSGGGKFYVFGEGYLLAELDGTFSRNACQFLRIGGSGGTSNSTFDDLIIFNSNQHTANHDQTYSVADAAYVSSQTILPEMAYASGDGTFLAVTDFTTTESNEPRYTIQIGRSGTYLYWNGSNWVASDGSYAQANSQSTFQDHVDGLSVDTALYAQMKVHFTTSNTLQSIDELTLSIFESTVYTINPTTITPQGRFQAAALISFDSDETTPMDTYVKYILEIDSQKKYWNGSRWANSNGTFSQSNFRQEVENHIVEAIPEDSAYVKVLILLKTDDPNSTPEIQSVTIDYEEDTGGTRGYLNGILQFIGAESLTDDEFESLPEDLDITDDVAVYEALMRILVSRDAVSDTTDRLTFYFQAKGAEITEPESAQSNVLVGGAL